MAAQRNTEVSDSRPGRREEDSDGEQVAGTGVRRGVAQLAHRTSFDLADPLTGEVEVFANLFERPRLAPIKTEAELEDCLLYTSPSPRDS